MRRVAVIGGGISGLAAAWAARRAALAGGHDLDVTVLEAGREVGGKAVTVARDGWLVETGPTGYLSSHTELERVVDEVGLRGEVVAADRAAARRFVLHAGRMRRVVPNPLGLVAGGLLSAGGMLRMLREPWIAARRDGADESVWSFAERRLGRETADRLIAPMVLGVFAGDATQLSLPAAFPKMAALEREHGSLIRALVLRRGRMPSGRLRSFRGGMQSLPRALGGSNAFTVRCNCAVTAIERRGERWSVNIADREPVAADTVIVAADVTRMAALVATMTPTLARELEAIPVPHVGVVALGFTGAAAAQVPHGFGVLIRRGEGVRALGHLWDSRIFPGRAPEGGALVRAIYGGAVDGAAQAMSDDELTGIARQESRQLYGITDEPAMAHVARWPHAIPQYVLGHRERVARAEDSLRGLPGVVLAGSALHGVSFGDAAASGVRAGEAAVRWLGALAGDPASSS